MTISVKNRFISSQRKMPKLQSFVCRFMRLGTHSCDSIFHRFIKYSEHAAAILTNDKLCFLSLSPQQYTEHTARRTNIWWRNWMWAAEILCACSCIIYVCAGQTYTCISFKCLQRRGKVTAHSVIYFTGVKSTEINQKKELWPDIIFSRQQCKNVKKNVAADPSFYG